MVMWQRMFSMPVMLTVRRRELAETRRVVMPIKLEFGSSVGFINKETIKTVTILPHCSS